ncbi:MAG: AtpZ/AtpI family protein [Polyangiales bacterium]
MLLAGRAFRREGAPNVVLGPRRGKQLSALAKMTSVGIEFSISTLIGLLGGQWIDEKLGSQPWLMIVGLLLGVVAGMRSLIRTARQANAESQRKAPETPDDQTPS